MRNTSGVCILRSLSRALIALSLSLYVRYLNSPCVQWRNVYYGRERQIIAAAVRGEKKIICTGAFIHKTFPLCFFFNIVIFYYYYFFFNAVNVKSSIRIFARARSSREAMRARWKDFIYILCIFCVCRARSVKCVLYRFIYEEFFFAILMVDCVRLSCEKTRI